MHFPRFLLFFLVSLVVAFEIEQDLALEIEQDLEPRQVTKKAKCAKGVHIIHFRGNGGQEAQGYGITLPLINAIRKAVPGTTNISVPYPKTSTGINQANLKAVANAKKLIASYHKSCPKTPLVLTGYSEGAAIQMNVVCGTSNAGATKTTPLSVQYKKSVIAVIIYADGTRTIGQSYNLGTCKRPGPFPRTNPGGCKNYAPVIRSYCNNKDKICCAGGNDMHEHYTYFKQYDGAVGKYVAAQYKKFKSG